MIRVKNSSFFVAEENQTSARKQKFLLIISRKTAIFANEKRLPAKKAEKSAKNPANQKRRMFSVPCRYAE